MRAAVEPVSLGRLALLGACLAVVAASGAARAQIGDGPSDPGLTLKQRQDMRFPQPVRVGSLTGEHVIQAGHNMKQIGTVVGVYRSGDDDLTMVIRYGGVFGLGARTIAPDLDNTDLVGPYVKIVDLDPKEIAKLPTFIANGGAFLRPDEMIRLGVDRKY